MGSVVEPYGIRIRGEEARLPGPILKVANDVNWHGEVHAVFAEHDDEVEIRQGTATIDQIKEVFVIDDGVTEHVFTFDEYVSHYRPMEVYH